MSAIAPPVLLELIGAHLDAQDLLLAASTVQRAGRHAALAQRLRLVAGLVMAAQSWEAPADEPAPNPDPDYALLAAAWGDRGEAAYADLEPLAVELGIVARRWPTMLLPRGKIDTRLSQYLGHWLSASGWPRRKYRNGLRYTMPK